MPTCLLTRSFQAARPRGFLTALAVLVGLQLAAAPAPAREGPELERFGAYLAEACDFAATPWCLLPGDARRSHISQIEALYLSRGDPRARDRLWGWGGPGETFGAWGGAAFDGRRFYFFGGGHHHYRGNDLKVYDLNDLRWSRLYDPAYVTERTHPAGKHRYVPEAGPRATHVYDGLSYDPATHALYLFGHNNFHAWRFDLGTWERTRDPWAAWQSFDLPQPDRGGRYGYFRTEALGDGRLLVHAGRAARGGGDMFALDAASGTYGKTARESFRVAALTAAGAFVYAINGRDASLVRYDRLGRAIQTYPMPTGISARASAYHPGRGLLTFWDGGAETVVFDVQRARWEAVGVAGDRPAPQGRPRGVWGAWAYVPGHDVFLGQAKDADGTLRMWAYRLPDPLPKVHPLKTRRLAEGYSCSDEVVGWQCPDLQRQVDQGQVAKGVYRQCATVRGPVDFNGAWLKQSVCGGKAALIARAGAQIANVRISDVTTGTNAACVRWEGGSVAIHKMSCRASDMGLLGNGQRLVIQDSEIVESRSGGRSLGHLVYACSRDAEGTELIVRDSRIADPGSDGHVVKSGCARTLIENSVLAGGARPYSRLVDAFNGGDLVIRDSQLLVGADGGNGDVIGYGAEMRTRHPVNRVALSAGRVDCGPVGRTYQLLHLWAGRASPSEVSWQPAETVNCPRR